MQTGRRASWGTHGKVVWPFVILVPAFAITYAIALGLGEGMSHLSRVLPPPPSKLENAHAKWDADQQAAAVKDYKDILSRLAAGRETGSIAKEPKGYAVASSVPAGHRPRGGTGRHEVCPRFHPQSRGGGPGG